ncbi:MAG: RdgB/HAM1 family non-canonical purine NTP pyrophosphatase [Saprospiraceae bacterium]|nr:RdgB/HAM1 family non-canonical purine NTP pyrophosphatase [Saprospiraceae bacterium]
MKILVFATNNANKAREVEQILGGRYLIKTLPDIGCTEEIEETESTLEGNALLKARFVKDRYGFDCFSEDTGLEVGALDGAPGVHTARYAGEARDANANTALLLRNLEGHADRSATFRTVIALLINGREILLEGACPGRIANVRRGDKGWGYDPVFIPEGYDQTFAELGDTVKNQVSHRARAMAKLVDTLQNLQQ